MRPSHRHESRPTRRSGFTGTPVEQAELGPEGDMILREVPGALGIQLWGALRDVMLWTESPRRDLRVSVPPLPAGADRERAGQVRAAEMDEDLQKVLLEMAAHTTSGVLSAVPLLADCCLRVSEWAQARGAVRTRLSFLRAAALLRPTDAKLALETGRLTRDLGYYAAAEGWLRASISLSRAQFDWETYAWGYVYLAWIYWRAGNLSAAMALARRALRKARRHHFRTLQGFAHHSSFVFLSDDDPREAYTHALGALRSFGSAHPRIPLLAQDVATYWADARHYQRALPVVEAVLPRVENLNERGLVTAGLARAGAGAGKREIYERARADALRTFSESPSDARWAEAFVVIARADALATEWERARAAAEQAIEIARRRGETLVLTAAEAELAAIRAGRLAAADTHPPEPPAAARQAERLRVELIQTLRAVQ
jgi:tetratricopeptide (TPR) repeat protein